MAVMKRFHTGSDVVDLQAGARTSGLNVDSGLIQSDHQLGTQAYDDAEYEVCIPTLPPDVREIATHGDTHGYINMGQNLNSSNAVAAPDKQTNCYEKIDVRSRFPDEHKYAALPRNVI